MMNNIQKIVVTAAISIPASGFFSGYNAGTLFQLNGSTAIAFFIVALACVLITGLSSISLPSSASLSSASKQNGGEYTGKVKWFNGGKGFGFIEADDGQEYFVHFRSVNKASARLNPNKRVSFGLVEGKKGLEADNVMVID